MACLSTTGHQSRACEFESQAGGSNLCGADEVFLGSLGGVDMEVRFAFGRRHLPVVRLKRIS